ncbi:CypX Cytochrome P450 [Pyrenophora tritici-repentis]|uniref:Cytochrome p450 n=1 Tax=Pyrenophora tritici-repentis TaxID=45151 RepID=A0A2W1H1V4_9PLEO|nr:cytochrome p450 [Pyrenophora tritici-repentis]KAF7455188.1 cytochrome p450 [Pyrenophora tritici-repentis]KAF7578351.1 CypX, Cytochrome P450 [Pyrenophora tritici-repentis]KAG9388942.1 cytochrome p450 [Pyrenophora tritici-repentis]KAI0585802.1 cytochrome p450 [Pyrenophora tritici-repentis]
MALESIHPLPSYVPLLAVIAAIFLGIIQDIWLWLRMPPGPMPLPFLGNKLHLPKSKPWIKFQEWSKTYGPIFTIWIGRKPTVVISDPNVAAELMEKRSAKYSSRPPMIAMGEILWDNASILVQPYGKEWSVRRKLLHQAVTPSALRLYKPVQTAEASRLCCQLLESPENWEKLLERFTSSIVFCVAYGHRIDSLNAEVIRQRFEFMHVAASLNVPGKYLVESFPILKHVPDVLAPWKADIKAKGRKEAAANMALVDLVRSDLTRAKSQGDDIPDSLCKLLLELREKEHIPLSDRDFSYIPASLFGAGSDTTASTLCTAFLALVTHPETLHAAHNELDAVVGPDRSPDFTDESHLPYIRALVKEVLRWRPVAVLGGTPHASTEDDHYEGYYIPNGTTILGNSWAINLNEEYYPNAHHFDPTRFLDDALAQRSKAPTPLTGKPHPSKSGHSSFGWGRRICPGANLAENSLYIALAKTLWAFDIQPRKGVDYDTFAYTEGFNIRPQKFVCDIKVRSEAHRRVLLSELEDAEAVLGKFTPFE